YALWFVQVVLALLFLSAGGAKLVVPVEALGMPFPLPAVFVHFVGVCEVLGALGLILPGVLRVRTQFTPLAALGLVTIMFGATMFTPPNQPQLVVVPVGIRLLPACVAYGRAPRASLPG